MFSEDRISHLAHLLQDRIWEDDLVDYADEGSVLREMKRVLQKYFSDAEAVDGWARNKILSQGKKIIEGSQEWEILYKKYFDEEIAKRRF